MIPWVVPGVLGLVALRPAAAPIGDIFLLRRCVCFFSGHVIRFLCTHQAESALLIGGQRFACRFLCIFSWLLL